MTARARRSFGLTALGALFVNISCGDVTSDLITGVPSAGAATGGASGAASGSGPSGTGGAGPGGTATGGSGLDGGATPECTTNDDCTDAERRFCSPARSVCVECTQEAHCDADENCSDELGECAVPCVTSTDCTDADDGICDTLIGFCVDCLDNPDCGPGGVCSNWQCD